jgi:hypothetical protein
MTFNMTFRKAGDTFSDASGTFKIKTETFKQTGAELSDKKPPLPPLAQTFNKRKSNPRILFSPKFPSSNTNLHFLLGKNTNDRKNASM